MADLPRQPTRRAQRDLTEALEQVIQTLAAQANIIAGLHAKVRGLEARLDALEDDPLDLIVTDIQH